MCNARLKPEYKVRRGDVCPVCHTERLTLECEVDAGKCVDCQSDLAGFTQEKCELRTILKEAM